MNKFKGENVENFYVESGVKSVAILKSHLIKLSRTAIFLRFSLMS